MTKHFSNAEKSLIRTLNFEWLIDVVESTGSVVEPKAWEIIALDAFVNNRQGPEVDALRRVMQALRACRPYRLTAEFDELCQLP